jgi:hypothetical protein
MKLSLHHFWNRVGADLLCRTDRTERVGLSAIRPKFLATLSDCECDRSQRLAQRIMKAHSADELWALRGDIHQCIAQAYTQSEASARINSLAPLFRGWLPEGRLAPI